MDTFSFYHQLMFFTENLQIVRLVHAQVAKKKYLRVESLPGNMFKLKCFIE